MEWGAGVGTIVKVKEWVMRVRGEKQRIGKMESIGNVFVKLLMLSNERGSFVLLYGFCIPTRQAVRKWKIQNVGKTKRSIWTAIMEKEEADQMISSFTHKYTIQTEKNEFTSPQLVKRKDVIANDEMVTIDGPVRSFCTITEYWNTNKKQLLEDIESALDVKGKKLLLEMQELFSWAVDECGIDFLKDGSRAGNFEYFHFSEYENYFSIETDKDSGLTHTAVVKQPNISGEFIVNCAAEHQGRTVSNQTKILKNDENRLDFYAKDPMSRVKVQVWDINNGKLLFCKEIILIMSISINVSYRDASLSISDPWSDKLTKSASNRGDLIKKQIMSTSRFTEYDRISVKKDTFTLIDNAFQEGKTLFSAFRTDKEKGAFVPCFQLDGEIDSFKKIKEYIEDPSVRKVVIADPYFSVLSAQKLLARIQRTNLELEVITSLSNTDPDTNENKNILAEYRYFLWANAGILHHNLVIRNLSRGKDPVFHDRYLIRYFKDGKTDGFLLSNSLNSMGQRYPFVVALMDKAVCHDVCEYLNELCDEECQRKKPVGQRVHCELLWDPSKKRTPAAETEAEVEDAVPPFESWLPSDCFDTGTSKIKKEKLADAILAIWGQWNSKKTLVCKMVSYMAANTYPWNGDDVAAILKTIPRAENDFCETFEVEAKTVEQRQNHQRKGPYSETFKMWALLNQMSEPDRQGFHMIFEHIGHVFYHKEPWLCGGYTLLLCLDETKFMILFEQLKSPLMFDALATHMLLSSVSQTLYYLAVRSNLLAVKLLGAEYILQCIQSGRLSCADMKAALEGLEPEFRALQLAYLLSRISFNVRTFRSEEWKSRDISEFNRWVQLKLAADLTMVKEDVRMQALYWLYDCEVCSNGNMHLKLAEAVYDQEVKEAIYKEVVCEEEKELLNTTYEKDLAAVIRQYLLAVQGLYKDSAETYILKNVVSWSAFETAAEPGLKDYNFDKWNSANVRAKWQIELLEEFTRKNLAAKKAKAWLEEWKPRLIESGE